MLYKTLFYLKSAFMEIFFEFICFLIKFFKTKNVKIKRLFCFILKLETPYFCSIVKYFKIK